MTKSWHLSPTCSTFTCCREHTEGSGTWGPPQLGTPTGGTSPEPPGHAEPGIAPGAAAMGGQDVTPTWGRFCPPCTHVYPCAPHVPIVSPQPVLPHVPPRLPRGRSPQRGGSRCWGPACCGGRNGDPAHHCHLRPGRHRTSSHGRCRGSHMAGTIQFLRSRCPRALNWPRAPRGTLEGPRTAPGSPGPMGGYIP